MSYRVITKSLSWGVGSGMRSGRITQLGEVSWIIWRITGCVDKTEEWLHGVILKVVEVGVL